MMEKSKNQSSAIVTSEVQKPNEAIVMVPTLGKLTAASRKIFNVLLRATQAQARSIESSGAEISARHLFRAKLSEVVDASTSTGADLHTVGKKYLREMAAVRVDWESPDSNSEVAWKNMALLSEVEIRKDERGAFVVRWALPPSLLAAVLDPKRFTTIDVEQVAKLGSYSSVALYEICSRYRNNPTGVTSCNDPQWWADALTGSPKNQKSETRRVREWRKVKNESVKRAIEEINQNTDLEIELFETKTGHAVTSVQFSVKRKPLAVENAQSAKPKISAGVLERAVRLGLSPRDVAGLVQDHQEAIVAAALDKTEARAARKDLDEIKSKLAYVRATAKEMSGQVEVEPAASTAPSTAPAAPVSIAPSFHDTRLAEIKKELLAQPMEVQKRLADMVFKRLQDAGIASPAVLRNYQTGKWEKGVLASKMIDLYIKENLPEDWDVDTQKIEIESESGVQS